MGRCSHWHFTCRDSTTLKESSTRRRYPGVGARSRWMGLEGEHIMATRGGGRNDDRSSQRNTGTGQRSTTGSSGGARSASGSGGRGTASTSGSRGGASGGG